MNILSNAQGEPVPARPSWKQDKETIIKMAITSLFAEEYCDFEESERKKLEETLLKQCSEPWDEYELGKDFEQDGWPVDASFLWKLDNVCGHIRYAKIDLEVAWFEEHKPLPPFEIGEQLIVWQQIGKIVGICDSRLAHFMVRTPDQDENSSYLVKFEDAVKVSQ